jgi:outer membrane lipopolysaccharide assembly protein LptE/RlpB
MMRRLALLWILPLFLGGCGYHFSGEVNNLPPEIRSLYIELFANRTAEPYLENFITNQVIEEFARSRNLHLTEDRTSADAVLSGTVSEYSTAPVSYGRDDEITEYRSAMGIDAVLYRASDGKALWKGNLSWTEEYPSNDDKTVQEDNEGAAIGVIVERLAEDLYFRIVDNF